MTLLDASKMALTELVTLMARLENPYRKNIEAVVEVLKAAIMRHEKEDL